MTSTGWNREMREKPLFLFLPFSSIFTLGSPHLGLFLALATLLQPNLGISGFLALFFAATCLRCFGLSFVAAQSSLRNSLLIGLLIGDLFALNFSILLFLVIFVMLTILLTTALETIFAKASLPTLSLPFCLVALMIFFLLPSLYKFSHLPTTIWRLEITQLLPSFAVYFFHSMASLLCLTNPAIGLLFWFGIAITSPLTALFLLTGFIIGTSVESLLHAVHHELFLYGEGYNYSLVFASLAGFFMVPSRLSLLLATIATTMTSMIVVIAGAILNPWNLPVLSLPFSLMLITALLSLKTLRPLALNKEFFSSPELNLEASSLLWNRHRYPEIGIFLPISGSWKIQQAFNGALTHRGLWQHALDFVATDENGAIFKKEGLELSDHFSFGKEILSPIEGYVVACVSNDEDNLIGQVANSRNWGNYLILKSISGFYVTLSHLKKNSLLVAVGNFVQVGQKLAECGNSGYSPEPHLHLQVSYYPEIGSATAPFHLLNYAIGGQIHFHRTPLLGETLRSLNANHSLKKVLNFRIGEELTFKVGKRRITITNQVDELSGRFYLTDGITKLYHSRIGTQFYFYGLEAKKFSPLYDLMLAAPRIPMIFGAEFEYFDTLPLFPTQGAARRFYSNLRQISGLKSKNCTAKYRTSKDGLEIYGSEFLPNGTSSFFKIDPAFGIQEFAVGNRQYVRV
jgi:urea transporter